MSPTDGTEHADPSGDFALFVAAIRELADIAGKLELGSLLSELGGAPDDEVSRWLCDCTALDALSTHAEYRDGIYVPDDILSDLLDRGRLIVERLYPAKTEPCNTIEEES